MVKLRDRARSSQSSSPPPGPIDQLTVDQAFQRLLKHFDEPPDEVCERHEQAIRTGKVTLWGRIKAGGSWFRTKPSIFKQHLVIEADEGPDGWHASVRMQAGKIGVKDFEQYEWAFASSEIDALCMPDETDRSPAGAKRGPKEKYDWELFKARFYLNLDDDDVPAHGNINFEQRAKDLREWGNEHPEIGEENTPSQSAMRAKVTEWAPLWPRLRAGHK
jgi:hypothetical protein